MRWLLTEWAAFFELGGCWSNDNDRTDDRPLGNHNDPHHIILYFNSEEDVHECAYCYDLRSLNISPVVPIVNLSRNSVPKT